MYWLLAREVLRLRGTIPRNTPWDVMIDLFFYRDPEEQTEEVAAEPTTWQQPEEPEGFSESIEPVASAVNNEDWNQPAQPAAQGAEPAADASW